MGDTGGSPEIQQRTLLPSDTGGTSADGLSEELSLIRWLLRVGGMVEDRPFCIGFAASVFDSLTMGHFLLQAKFTWHLTPSENHVYSQWIEYYAMLHRSIVSLWVCLKGRMQNRLGLLCVQKKTFWRTQQHFWSIFCTAFVLDHRFNFHIVNLDFYVYLCVWHMLHLQLSYWSKFCLLLDVLVCFNLRITYTGMQFCLFWSVRFQPYFVLLD